MKDRPLLSYGAVRVVELIFLHDKIFSAKLPTRRKLLSSLHFLKKSTLPLAVIPEVNINTPPFLPSFLSGCASLFRTMFGLWHFFIVNFSPTFFKRCPAALKVFCAKSNLLQQSVAETPRRHKRRDLWNATQSQTGTQSSLVQPVCLCWNTSKHTINLKPQHQRTWEVFIFFSCKWSKEFHHLCFLFSKAETTEQSLWLFDPQPPIWLKHGFVQFFFPFPPLCLSDVDYKVLSTAQTLQRSIFKSHWQVVP